MVMLFFLVAWLFLQPIMAEFFVVSPDSLKFKHWNWIQITLSGGFLHKKPFFYKLPDNAWFTYFLSVFPRLSSKIKTSQWYTQFGSPICRITKLEVLQLLFYWRYIPQFAESRNLKSHKFWSTEGIYTWNFRQAALTIMPLDGPSLLGIASPWTSKWQKETRKNKVSGAWSHETNMNRNII